MKEVRHLGNGLLGIPGRGNSCCKSRGAQAYLAIRATVEILVYLKWPKQQKEEEMKPETREVRVGAVVKGLKGLKLLLLAKRGALAQFAAESHGVTYF